MRNVIGDTTNLEVVFDNAGFCQVHIDLLTMESKYSGSFSSDLGNWIDFYTSCAKILRLYHK